MASKYIQKYPIPGDFPELLHDFAREILRDQPENIFEYGAQYFAALERGEQFSYGQIGKAVPPPRDREPSQGNIHQMPEGVMPESQQQQMAEMEAERQMEAAESGEIMQQ